MQKLCCVCTRQQFSASLDYFVTSSPPYLHQFSTISGGNCIREPRGMPQSIPYSRMTSTMIHFKGHSWQTSRHKASMMLLTLIMTLRMVTTMKRNFSKESSPLYILFWLLHFKHKRGENWSKNLKEMPGPSSCNYTITIQNQMLHNMTSSP